MRFLSLLKSDAVITGLVISVVGSAIVALSALFYAHVINLREQSRQRDDIKGEILYRIPHAIQAIVSEPPDLPLAKKRLDGVESSHCLHEKFQQIRLVALVNQFNSISDNPIDEDTVGLAADPGDTVDSLLNLTNRLSNSLLASATQGMSIADILLEYFKVLAWPLVVLILGWRSLSALNRQPTPPAIEQ